MADRTNIEWTDATRRYAVEAPPEPRRPDGRQQGRAGVDRRDPLRREGPDAALDRDRDDPDWRVDYTNRFDHRNGTQHWLNVAGGMGFHGDRFHVMYRAGKRAAGRLLDGVEHNAFPEQSR